MTRTRHITISAMTIGLVLVSFTVFRHTTNLINAIIVPLTLAVLLFHIPIKQKVIIYVITYMLVVLFFPTQLVFMLLYVIVASRLKYIMINQSVLIWLGHVLVFALMLMIATYLTDFIFMLKINHFIFLMLGQRVLFFIGFYLIESVGILLVHTLMMKQINKRMRLKNG